MPASTRNTIGPHDGDDLQPHVDRFVSAWSAALPDQAVDLAAFLPDPGSSLRLAVLRQLIPIDLENRWQRNRRALLEEYLRGFPELDGNKGPPPDLVYEEFRIRHLHGDRPDPDEYHRRFPAAFDSFRRILDESPLSSVLMDAARTPVTLGFNRSASEKPPAIVAPLNQPGFVLPSSSGYRLLKRLGRGSYGEVWKAEAPGGVPVAVKIVSHSLDTAESQQELKALELIRELHHPYLTQTHAFWAMEDRLVIVMDLADSSLSDRFRVCTEKEGLAGIPLEELVRYIDQSAEALDFLHARNIQHRDIKPENILLVQGNVKVADFGLAKLKDQRMLMSATSAGTPAYMAPEVWKRQVSAASDQYSLAGTYLFLRRGRQPFSASNFWALMHAHLQDEPDLGDLLPAESLVLARALAKDPIHRYPSCSEFALELRRALALATDTTPEARKPELSRWALLAVLAAMVLLASLIFFPIVQPFFNRPVVSDELKADEPWLPARGFAKAADAEVRSVGGRKLYSRIELRRFDPIATFLLIEKRPEEPNDPPAFYMMETEVPHKLFEAMAASPEYQERLRRLDKDMSWLAPGEWVKGWDVPSPGKLKPDHPVTRVTVTEAYWCAEVGGCNLPTVEQWLRAAGASRSAKGPKGPYEEPYQPDEIAVGRGAGRGPLSVGTAQKDRVSSTGCKDMAGNVTEWTRNLSGAKGMVPVVNPMQIIYVVALGNNFVDKRPFVFGDPDQDFALNWKENNLGFRMVLEPP